jgi:hypothetical protein
LGSVRSGTSPSVGAQRESEVRAVVVALGGAVVSRSRIDDIAYHALLVDLPVPAVRDVVERSPDGIAGLQPVMHIRPQSVVSSLEVSEDAGASGGVAQRSALREPILGLLDGVPVAAHPLLAAHLVVDDQFDLVTDAPVAERFHGTAMASLIVHGDRNQSEEPLPRRIHVVPVLGGSDSFPGARLVVDIIYLAVIGMRGGPDATAPGVLIVNLSLGNARRPFHGQLSAWARLLDRLAYRYGLLFVVSAGNSTGHIGIAGYSTRGQFEDALPAARAADTLRAIGSIAADRRLLSPAETVNGLTVGACNSDAVTPADRATARVNVDPYGSLRMVNPSSCLGPGFALSVKPDVLFPGAREHLRYRRSNPHIEVSPAAASRSAGLRVAAPPQGGLENRDGYTCGTSAAAALASRTAHRIHDALEAAYGDTFVGLSHIERAVLLKALLAHPAKWPEEAADLIRRIIGPADGRQHVRQKDNIRRFLGFGAVEADDAVACAADRATFWATGSLDPKKIAVIEIPVPAVMGGKARPHAVSATLAWFTPTMPGRRSYRSVRLTLLTPEDLGALAIKAHPNQPDANQTNRGTIFSRCWSGTKAPAIGPDDSFRLTVQRDNDQGTAVDEAVPFGLAVTIAMPGVVEIYEQVRQRLAIKARTSA